MAIDEQPQKARKIRELYELGLDYDLPSPAVFISSRDTSLAADGKRLEQWVNDVNDLIREHGGRPFGGKLHVLFRKRDQCSVCHSPWELADDEEQPPYWEFANDEGQPPHCAHCGAEAESDGE